MNRLLQQQPNAEWILLIPVKIPSDDWSMDLDHDILDNDWFKSSQHLKSRVQSTTRQITAAS